MIFALSTFTDCPENGQRQDSTKIKETEYTSGRNEVHPPAAFTRHDSLLSVSSSRCRKAIPIAGIVKNAGCALTPEDQIEYILCRKDNKPFTAMFDLNYKMSVLL
ncbi:hypothetical protein PSSHI_29930 [Photobacterium sp. R1]